MNNNLLRYEMIRLKKFQQVRPNHPMLASNRLFENFCQTITPAHIFQLIILLSTILSNSIFFFRSPNLFSLLFLLPYLIFNIFIFYSLFLSTFLMLVNKKKIYPQNFLFFPENILSMFAFFIGRDDAFDVCEEETPTREGVTLFVQFFFSLRIF